MSKAVLNKMFENLLHIGNKSNYWNPKMKSYIYGSVNWVHVIDLTKTSEKLEEVKSEIKEIHQSGKKILFVGTKLQARDAVKQIAKDSGHYYVAEKWVPGLLTNFKTIKKRISTYIKLSSDLENWAFDMLTKKEKAAKMLEHEKLEKAYAWVKDMKKMPDYIFVVDGVYEDQAVREANSLKIKSFAILNTNGDDTLVDNCVPANTNAVKSIEYVVSEIASCLTGGVNEKTSNASKVKKVDDTKISGEKKATKKPTVKKVSE